MKYVLIGIGILAAATAEGLAVGAVGAGLRGGLDSAALAVVAVMVAMAVGANLLIWVGAQEMKQP